MHSPHPMPMEVHRMSSGRTIVEDELDDIAVLDADDIRAEVLVLYERARQCLFQPVSGLWIRCREGDVVHGVEAHVDCI